MFEYKNGNAIIKIASDGTRSVEYTDNELKLDYPLNIDIRVSNRCSFGMKADGSLGLCTFCHEEAKVDGKECNYKILKNKLDELPKYIELAIGANFISDEFVDFLQWCKSKEFICNLTINQGHLKRDIFKLLELIENKLIYGLGISYRGSLNWNVPQEILDYEHTVFHVIMGIDTFDEVMLLKNKGVKKVLILGEKDFGFNSGRVDLKSLNHKQWKWWVFKLFDQFDVVSFDNLALEQLILQRFFTKKEWDLIYQEENSFYINAVDGYLSLSSRSEFKVDWDAITLTNYFKIRNDNEKTNTKTDN